MERSTEGSLVGMSIVGLSDIETNLTDIAVEPVSSWEDVVDKSSQNTSSCEQADHSSISPVVIVEDAGLGKKINHSGVLEVRANFRSDWELQWYGR